MSLESTLFRKGVRPRQGERGGGVVIVVVQWSLTRHVGYSASTCICIEKAGRDTKRQDSGTLVQMGTKPVRMPMPVTTGSRSVEYVSEGKKGGTSSLHEDGDRRHEFGFQTL
jgi:hypothetical protein